ncbi:MAG TPA: amino acid adenylation domain-containing protein [Longimicrobium sp.]|jgi:amino acid adenylation domain-containing protein/non-ribosomal peptide synthase protein (TIGR01720 family)|uniref:amino acid adenylation domain-containing protein n=1 Tax=Longimicrobium sp. TaxID=2029185 RepID=UPI002EDAE560
MSTSNLTAKRAALSDAKRALLEARLRGLEPSASMQRAGVTRVAGPGPVHPLSFAQERMWFLCQYDPDLPLYNVPVANLISASVQVDALEKAASEVVRRHEALRTIFRMIDGQPRQIVLDPYPVKVEIRDLRPRMGSEFLPSVRRLVEEDGARPFDLSTGPLFRVGLLRVSDEQYVMMINTHHIATDGWAYPIILGELDQFYGEFSRGRTPSLPLPTLRYADYAVWERQHLQGETLERHVAFWREHLAGANDTEIAGDRPRPPQQSFRGAFHNFRVPVPVTEAARALARGSSATLNMVMLAALDLQLARYTQTEDITVGTLLGNRQRAELEQVVGFFVNTAAVRLDLRGDPTFRELVGRCKRMILDVGEHQELPFDRVVDALNVQRDPSRQPLFQIMYFHHVYSAAFQQQEGQITNALDARPIYDNHHVSLIDTGAAPFDLMLASVETEDGLDCNIEYSRDLFDPATMDLFGRRFTLMLQRAVAQPDVPISRLSLLTDDEERQVLREWAASAAPADAPDSVVALLERRAADSPDAPAIVADGASLSYAELAARARGVAARLRGMGVGAEDRVAVCMERGAAALVAMMGVMRAGAAYVPVDPELPAERMAWMLEDSGAAAVLADASTAARIPSGTPVIEVDSTAEIGTSSADAELPHSRTDALPHSSSAAYVIYTSGSTGRPKGVVVSHGALANLAAGIAQRYGLAEGDRVLQFASPSFDVSLEEIFPTWAAGGAVVPRTEGTPAAGPQLAAWAEERGITVLNLPTAYWHEWVREMDERGGAPPATLRLMVVGGERARPEAFGAWERVGRGVPLLNGYGPTEATVTATVHQAVSAADPRAEVPIGRPVAGARAFVLDKRGEPSAPGIPGELYLGGPGVARGYLGRPGLTAEKFVPDPFSADPGARLYRTGDRARWRTDGTLEFMGRVDEQIKVRGFRIEPGEIEAALRTHAAVRDAAVAAREDARGQRRLVAYVAGDAGSIDSAGLRAHLRRTLPEHMVPAVFVALDALPLTPSGKVDRRALPDPEAPAEEPDAPFEAPRGDVEETLARLWAEALGRERVGAHENFFELGGDSILSILVIGRAADHGIRITPRQMFLHPTIAELATVAGTAAPVQAEQGPVTGPAPLTPSQQWFFDGEPADPHHWNHAAYVALPHGADPAVVGAALEALAAHHDALRLRFERGEDGWRQWLAEPGEPVPLEVVDLGDVADDEVDAAVLPHAERAQAGLDLARGPLVRGVLFDLGASRPPRLLLVVHHLVVDAVSWPIVLEDLQTAYLALAAGAAPRLPAKTTSFKAWTERLAAHAHSPEILAQAEFWHASLPASLPPLPMDDAGAPDTEEHSAVVQVALEEADTEALVQGTAAYGVRVEELLLAGLLAAVREWSGAESVLVELEGHGREDLFDGVDLSRTVGWFTATYPLQLSAPAHAGPGETLKAVKEQVRAVPGRGMGWGLLRWMGPDDVRARMAALPWPEVTFNYMGQRGGTTGLMGGSGGDERAFDAAGHVPGATRSPRQVRRERISIDSLMIDRRLWMMIFYGGRVFRPETMQRLADAYARALRELAAHCAAEGAGGFTPSDFPEAGLDQGALDALMAQLGGLEG